MGCQFGKGPGHRHFGGLIARYIQAKDIGGAEKSLQCPIAVIALQPEGPAEQEFDKWLSFPGAALFGPQVMGAHAGELGDGGLRSWGIGGSHSRLGSVQRKTTGANSASLQTLQPRRSSSSAAQPRQ